MHLGMWSAGETQMAMDTEEWVQEQSAFFAFFRSHRTKAKAKGTAKAKRSCGV